MTGDASRYFHKIGPPETLSKFNYEAPEEACDNRKLFDSPL